MRIVALLPSLREDRRPPSQLLIFPSALVREFGSGKKLGRTAVFSYFLSIHGFTKNYCVKGTSVSRLGGVAAKGAPSSWSDAVISNVPLKVSSRKENNP